MAYIYDADLWCNSCGEDIVARLTSEGKAPTNPDDEHSFDSGEFPKAVGDPGESDCPSHCGGGEECLEAEILPGGRKIGALLSTSLTSDGVEYVKEAVANGGEVAEFWREQFSWIEFPEEETSDA